MHGFYVHGPTLTYVTDATLSPAEQQRVLTEFCRCAGDQMLRVAFRLPNESDIDIERLFNWYLRMIETEGVSLLMLPPLIHNRPDLAARYPASHLWLSAQWLDDFHTANAYSVHSTTEAMDAFDAGARELIFGHVFTSDSHPGEAGRGVAALREIAATIRMDDDKPLITAIGGINEASIRAIGRVGVRSVACIRAISRSPDIPQTLREMLQSWDSGYTEFLEKGTLHD